MKPLSLTLQEQQNETGIRETARGRRVQALPL